VSGAPAGPSAPEIRDARADELEAASAVIRAAYMEYRPAFPTSVWEAYINDSADVRRRLAESELIVVLQDGRVAGCVTFYPESARSTVEGWPAGWTAIRLLAVAPEFRGRGLGRALTEECLRRTRARGVPTVGLHTTELMAVARAMYERMGFLRVPEYDFHPAPGITVLAYRLDLPAA
jgi:ribosomal protein S18 acetylase RimI-like enzyme